MKKITLLFLVLISAFLSCKKSGPANYITAEMDGKPMNFGPGGAMRLPNAGVDEIVIFGKGPAYRGDGFSLMIDNGPSGKAITAGTYYDTSSDFNVSLVYTQDLSREYTSDAEVARLTDSAGISVSHHLRVDITSIDSLTVKGTFSADVYLPWDLSIPPIYMSDGKINTRFQ